MPRRGFTENNRKIVFNRIDNPHGVGKCWHCGKRLYFKKRTARDGPNAWHMDHYPIPYKDIENQFCCGVTDERDLSNVVPACVSCNMSHIFEDHNGRWYHCGYLQSPLGNKIFCIRYLGECSWLGKTFIGGPIILIIAVFLIIILYGLYLLYDL